MKSDVYFTEVKSSNLKQVLKALQDLIKHINFSRTFKKDEIVPVKITIGDSKCVNHLRPELVRVVVSELNRIKTRPFVFDTNVIYKGRRNNTIDHLRLAQDKGFSYTKIGAPFIIADGLFGQDGREHKVDSHLLNKIKLPSFIGMLDSLIVLSHITGHILSGYAGAIKNVSMGMCSRSTKQIQHSSLKPSVIKDKCTACGCCIEICPVSAIILKNGKAFIDQEICIGCGECICVCNFDAIFINFKEDAFIFCQRMVEVCKVILSKFKNKFFINFTLDITKECDCISTEDEKIISDNIGILASQDILSIEKASVDLINKSEDVFLRHQGNRVYHKMLNYAAERGLGNIDYNLIKLSS